MLSEIKRYQVRNLLGEGAMAKVYEAYDPRIDRNLAIKVLRKELCVDSEYIMRFLREAKAVGALSHPHIVTVFDVDEHKNVPFIVMELLEGIPLSVLMNSGKKFSLQDVVTIGKQLALGLDYAHSRGIVHRDVKPSNIICSPSELDIKITDFGIAHIEDTELTQHTRIGDLLGTPQYMSPEQLEGIRIDGRSDLFSVGVVLYQLLTSERPFAGNNVATLMYQITHIEPKAVNEFNKNIPPALSYIMQKLLAKDPKKRFQTGRELFDSLSHCLEKNGKRAKEQKIVPIRVKWSLLMASIVSIAMIASIAIIFNKQYRALNAQMNQYGDSIVTFVATESAIPLLSEDWVSIELFVQEATQRQKNFQYMAIVDHRGIVRGSDRRKAIGKKYQGPRGKASSNTVDFAKVFRHVFKGGKSAVVDYSAPVLFQNQKIGVIHLGISQSSLQQLAELTLYMMAALLVITLVVVVVFSYILGKYFSQSIYVVKKSLEQIIEGRYHQRIAKHQNDEFGQLYDTFNRMAETLQRLKIQSNKNTKNRTQPPITDSVLNEPFPTKTKVIAPNNRKTPKDAPIR